MMPTMLFNIRVHSDVNVVATSTGKDDNDVVVHDEDEGGGNVEY